MMMDDLLTDTTNIIDTNVKEENTLVFLNVHLFFSSDFFLKLDGLSFGAEPLTIHLIYTSWTENANFKNLSQNRANRANCKLGSSWIKSLAHSKDDLNVSLGLECNHKKSLQASQRVVHCTMLR